MSNLAIKEVNFNGDVLMAAQDKTTDKIYVGVSWICNGIGFSKSQKDTQIQKIQTDLVLKQGCLKFQAGVFDQNNETLAIELDFLPLWLAKITLTPTMQKEQPFIVAKLVDYQLKAKGVLANAFIHNNQLSNELTFLQGMLDQMKNHELRFKQIEDNQKDQQNKVVYLETEFNKETVTEGYKANDYVARKFNLFSLKDKPHSQFVDAIAQELKIYKNAIGYKDDYVNARREKIYNGSVGVAVYYSDKAINLIEEYLGHNFNPTRKDYKRGENKGKFNESCFNVGNTTYKFNENTYNKYTN